jgi:hypothetical protein
MKPVAARRILIDAEARDAGILDSKKHAGDGRLRGAETGELLKSGFPARQRRITLTLTTLTGGAGALART